MAAVTAGPAYRLLGKKDLGATEMPLADAALVDEFIALLATLHASRLTHPGGESWPALDQPCARTDPSSKAAHRQLLEKAAKGPIELYFVGDSITRRWAAVDYPQFLANWNRNFHGWNAANFGWGGDTIPNILWRLQNGELDGVQPEVIVVLAGTNNLQTAVPGQNDDDQVAGIGRVILAILDACRQKAPKSLIVLMGITPRNDRRAAMAAINRIQSRIARFAVSKEVRYLNINASSLDLRISERLPREDRSSRFEDRGSFPMVGSNSTARRDWGRFVARRTASLLCGRKACDKSATGRHPDSECITGPY